MIRRIFSLAPVAVLLSVVGPTVAQAPPEYPRVRAALHEIREARAFLQKAGDTYPPQERERALRALAGAIETLKTILAVRNVDDFRGVDRNPEYYTRYPDHARLRAALEDIRDARDEMRAAKNNFGGLKPQVIDDLDVAAGSLVTLIRR
ncbi:MAG TPA: hypothetical protein VM597_07085 [Gemmataceae bacterium]|nr:hypothetical protein [Gemmataceae bacterium]